MKIHIATLLTAIVAMGMQAQGKASPPPVKTLKEPTEVTAHNRNVAPQFPGGMQAFYTLVSKQIKVPKTKENMTARILVSFVVERDGSMGSFQILKDPGYGMGEQVVQILKSVKEKWSPGLQDGTPMRATYTFPLTINITN